MFEPLKNEKGFSLIEMIAVLIILGTIFSLLIMRYVDFDSNTKKQVEHYESTSVERKTVYDKYMENWYDPNNREDFK